LRLGIQDALGDPEQVERAARKPVNPRHLDHVVGGEAVERPEKLALISARTRYCLAIDVQAAALGGAQLLKLVVEGCPYVMTRA
jgi:hypothetical protein